MGGGVARSIAATRCGRALVPLLAAALAAPAPAGAVGLSAGRDETVALFQLLESPVLPLQAAAGAAGGPLRPVQTLWPRSAAAPALATGADGTTVAAWYGSNTLLYYGGASPVLASTRGPGGRFSRPVTLARTLGGPIAVAANARRGAVVGWIAAERLYLAVRENGGEFGPAERVLDDVDDFSLGMADGGEVVVAAIHRRAGDDAARLLGLTRAPGGAVGEPRALAPATERPGGPRLAAAGERALVTWQSTAHPGSVPVVEWTRGGGFGEPRALTAPDPERGATGPRVALAPGGEAIVAWSARGPDAIRASIRPAGGGFGPPVDVLPGTAGSHGATLLDMNARGHAAIARTGESAWAAAYRPRGAGFRPAVTTVADPLRPGRVVGRPGLAVDAAGRATLAWDSSDFEVARAFVRGLGPDGLGPLRLVAASRTYVRHKPARRCFPRGSRTLARNARARVYALRDELYGCLYARGQPIRLADDEEWFPAQNPVALTGPLVAYMYRSCDPEDCVHLLRVADLRDGVRGINRDGSGDEEIGSIVLTPLGAVAWITRGRTPWVNRLGTDDDFHPDVLARGPGIDARSLRLDGSRLTWVDGRRTRSAGLR